jgi:hypothetical protein
MSFEVEAAWRQLDHHPLNRGEGMKLRLMLVAPMAVVTVIVSPITSIAATPSITSASAIKQSSNKAAASDCSRVLPKPIGGKDSNQDKMVYYQMCGPRGETQNTNAIHACTRGRPVKGDQFIVDCDTTAVGLKPFATLYLVKNGNEKPVELTRTMLHKNPGEHQWIRLRGTIVGNYSFRGGFISSLGIPVKPGPYEEWMKWGQSVSSHGKSASERRFHRCNNPVPDVTRRGFIRIAKVCSNSRVIVFYKHGQLRLHTNALPKKTIENLQVGGRKNIIAVRLQRVG